MVEFVLNLVMFALLYDMVKNNMKLLPKKGILKFPGRNTMVTVNPFLNKKRSSSTTFRTNLTIQAVELRKYALTFSSK